MATEGTTVMDMLKFVVMTPGEVFVDKQQHFMMPVSFVGSWDSLPMVHKHQFDFSSIIILNESQKLVHACSINYNYTGAILRQSQYYSPPTLSYHIGIANCTGGEDTLLSCSYSSFNPGDQCTFEAGVICQGEPQCTDCCTLSEKPHEHIALYSHLSPQCMQYIQ